MEASKAKILARRQRVSDVEKRQLAAILTIGWFAFSVVMLSLVFMMDYRSYETSFSEVSSRIKDHLSKRIQGNELVLEGFASYLAGMGHFDEQSAVLYAGDVMARFPYIYMLEVAEGVNQANLQDLVQRQIAQGYPEYSVRSFDYTGERTWQALPPAERYYPLIFMHPLPDNSRPVLGLDMGSHPHLIESLERALATGSYQTSLPFRLIEGDNAYVMFMAVPDSSSFDKGRSFASPSAKYLAVLVLRAEHILSQVDELLPANAGMLVYHNDKQPDDPEGHLFRKALPDTGFMPVVRHQHSLEEERQGFVLVLEKRFGLADISGDILLLALTASLLLFLAIRIFILRRYQADMTRVKQDAQLELLAKYDALTSLPNKNRLLEWLNESLLDLAKDSSVAVLYIDLDDFKATNDRYGHAAGDEVLRTVAARIRSTLGEGDFVVRLGEDEFVVLLMHYGTSHGISRIVDELQSKIKEPMEIEGQVLKTSACIGVAFYPESTQDPMKLIDLADRVMYQEKRLRGRSVQ